MPAFFLCLVLLSPLCQTESLATTKIAQVQQFNPTKTPPEILNSAVQNACTHPLDSYLATASYMDSDNENISVWASMTVIQTFDALKNDTSLLTLYTDNNTAVRTLSVYGIDRAKAKDEIRKRCSNRS
jgi:hypothetical protein